MNEPIRLVKRTLVMRVVALLFAVFAVVGAFAFVYTATAWEVIKAICSKVRT